MVQHLIVPIDGSEHSWRAAEVAVALAKRCVARVSIVEVVFEPRERPDAERRLDRGIRRLDAPDVDIEPVVVVATEGVAAAIADLAEERPDAVLTMASHGRGRSAALLGSIAEDVLRRTFGPIVVVGPRAELSDFSGPIVATVDGSDLAETALPLAAAWGIELGATAWVVEVTDPDLRVPDDVGPGGYPARLATKLAKASGHDVQYEVLRGRHPDDAVAQFAESVGASLVVASTHGRTGAKRFVVGSVAAGFVRHLPCPVLLLRPPHLRDTTDARSHDGVGAVGAAGAPPG
jgi:nucleotide-binding universal stress UspA family protein